MTTSGPRPVTGALGTTRYACPACSRTMPTPDEAARHCMGNAPDAQPDTHQIGGTHYTTLTVQPWDAMQAWLTPEQFAGFLHGNTIKYLARAGRKGDRREDLQKARHYLDKLIAILDKGS